MEDKQLILTPIKSSKTSPTKNPIKSPTKSSQKSPSKGQKHPRLKLDDFIILQQLGQGAYSDVYLVEKKLDGKQFAMKQILKKKLLKEYKKYQAIIQKQLLSCMHHQGIIRLWYSFQDQYSLYFILQLGQGGKFYTFMKQKLYWSTNQIKQIYIAQLVNIIQYLHNNGIIHRDIKPENILLSKNRHIKLIDFGTADIKNCKILSKEGKQLINKHKTKQRQQLNKLINFDNDKQNQKQSHNNRSTFVGTCCYMAPQMIQFNYCSPSVDLWALGCILYQMYYFQPPFMDKEQFAIFQKIKIANINYKKFRLIMYLKKLQI